MPHSSSLPSGSGLNASVYFLVLTMLATGTMNTLLNKLQDLQCVHNCDDPDPSNHHFFEQPVWQTINMFVGEAMCLAVFHLSQAFTSKPQSSAALPTTHQDIATTDNVAILADTNEHTPLTGNSQAIKKRVPLKGWATFLLWLPTLCDMTATSLMNVGLLFVSASIYQMLRGAVVLFTAVFSTIFLGRIHAPHKWFALATVFLGICLVGASSIIQSAPSPGVPGLHSSPMGVFIIILAQAITATQFVLEERILDKYDVPPLRAVGLEGSFGLLSAALGLPFMYFWLGKKGGEGNFWDIPEGFNEIMGSSTLLWASFGICFSIALFNWSGLSVTRSVSATARSTIDTCRTVFIWCVSFGLGWESFKSLQVIGFVFLIYGSFVFNEVIQAPACFRRKASGQSEVVVHED